MSGPCLFCRIVAREIPADIVHEGERLLAFRDINPQAPVHVLVIPKEHVGSLAHVGDPARDVLGELLLAVRDLAAAEGIAETGYRTVVYTGRNGGQTVGHLHVHLLGGRALEWPPG